MADTLHAPTRTVLADAVRIQAETRPDKIAFKFEGDEMTYAEFDRGASQVARGLIDLGVQPNERVGFLGKNSHLYFQMLMGVSKAGGVTCPVNWRLAGPEIVYILNDAKVRVLFVGPEFTDVVRAIRGDLETVQHVFCLEGVDGEFPDFNTWRDGFSDEDIQVVRSFGDDALQMYTSGTTGRPKGAIMSNRSVLGMREPGVRTQTIEWNTWTSEDVSLVAMPAFHIGGTGWGLTGLYEGATGVVMREFDPLKVLDFIDEHRISKIFMVPAAMKIVVEQPKAKEVDFSPLKYMLYGASPIPLDLLKTCMDVFQCGFVQMYGMTETSGTIVALPPEDHDPNGNEKMRSAGKPMEGVEVVIMGEDGRILPPGEVGEIASRSIANMSGYWNLPEATAKTITEDGWLRTGDAGYMDEDGYVYIHDRVKDMIISGGENIYPAEVENAVFGHQKVADVAVIGVPHEKWGEAVKAIVVVKPGETVTEDEIIAFAKTRIAGFKCPKSVDFIEALPRNPSGKILRKDLRAPYWDGKERAVN